MYTYGCLYGPSFDPIRPYKSLLVCDDDNGGGGQFLVSHYLQFNTSYILVVTTYDPDVAGPYSIIAEGPWRVDFTLIVPTTPSPYSKLLRYRYISKLSARLISNYHCATILRFFVIK